MFPGILHENERRRSRRISSPVGSDGTSAETTTPALMKLALKEQNEVGHDEESE